MMMKKKKLVGGETNKRWERRLQRSSRRGKGEEVVVEGEVEGERIHRVGKGRRRPRPLQKRS